VPGVTIAPGAGGITVSGTGISVDVAQSRRVRLFNISNNVEVQIGNGIWTRPPEGMEIGVGDQVRTGVMSSVTINFWEGHSGQLKERSQVQIRSNGAWLGYGEIRVSTGQPRSTPSDFELSTPACTINVRGTIFTVNHETTQESTVVWVEDGTILLTPSNRSLQSATVYSGQEVRVSRGYVSPVTTRGAAIIVSPSVYVGPSMAGVWVSSSGDTVQFNQDGSRVTGDWGGSHGTGVIAGVIENGVFRGTITIGTTTGTVVLTLRADGRLEGTVSSPAFSGPVILTRSR
jgi:hypothetical protein